MAPGAVGNSRTHTSRLAVSQAVHMGSWKLDSLLVLMGRATQYGLTPGSLIISSMWAIVALYCASQSMNITSMVRPRSWATLSSELRYDTDRKEMRYSDTYLTISPNDRWSDSIGHLYFREDPRFGPDSDNNLIRNSFYFRMNENWGFRMTHYLEMRDGLLEEQTYTISGAFPG